MPKLAKVTKVNPDSRTVDVVLVDTQQPISRVQIASGSASSDGGTWDVPDTDPPTPGALPATYQPGKRNLFALIDYVNGRPMVTGWAPPFGTPMTFKEHDRHVHRHPKSGAYVTIAPDGSLEAFHPSGGYIRLGTGDHQNLATISDGSWVEASGGAPATLTVSLLNGFKLQVDPLGNVTMSAQGNANITVKGTANLTAQGNLTLGGANIELAGPVTVDGDLTVRGNEQVNGSIHANGNITHG